MPLCHTWLLMAKVSVLELLTSYVGLILVLPPSYPSCLTGHFFFFFLTCPSQAGTADTFFSHLSGSTMVTNTGVFDSGIPAAFHDRALRDRHPVFRGAPGPAARQLHDGQPDEPLPDERRHSPAAAHNAARHARSAACSYHPGINPPAAGI